MIRQRIAGLREIGARVVSGYVPARVDPERLKTHTPLSDSTSVALKGSHIPAETSTRAHRSGSCGGQRMHACLLFLRFAR